MLQNWQDFVAIHLASKAAASRTVRWPHRPCGTVTTHRSLEDSSACALAVSWEVGQPNAIIITSGYRLISAVSSRSPWYRHKEGKLWNSGWRVIQFHTVWIPSTLCLINRGIGWRYRKFWTFLVFLVFSFFFIVLFLSRQYGYRIREGLDYTSSRLFSFRFKLRQIYVWQGCTQ